MGLSNRFPDERFSTRLEKYFRLSDKWVLAPARVIVADTRGLVGGGILLLFLFMGTIGVMIVPAPDGTSPNLMQPFVSMKHPLGTTQQGLDLLRYIVHATPPMLKMILAGGVFSTGMATIMGTVSGYKAGKVDRLIVTITDIVMAVPGLPLVIVLVTFLQPRDPFVVGVLLTINAWAGLARAIRSQVLTLREEAYVEASRIMGVNLRDILVADILPGLMPYIIVNFMKSARGVIFSSVGLYFLGVLPFTVQNWGVLLNQAYNQGALYTWDATHWLLEPIIVIGLLSLGLILFGQSFDRVFNPRTRARHEETSAEHPSSVKA